METSSVNYFFVTLSFHSGTVDKYLDVATIHEVESVNTLLIGSIHQSR